MRQSEFSHGRVEAVMPERVLICDPPSGDSAVPSGQGWAAVNSLGLLDLIQLDAEGLTPKAQYQVYLADSDQTPFGKLERLAVLKTNPDGAGIVQSIGPLGAIMWASDPWETSSYCWVVICKNAKAHNSENMMFGSGSPHGRFRDRLSRL